MAAMRLSDFTYDLPAERIALVPPKVRGTSRLLVLHKDSGALEHRGYQDFVKYVQPGDVVVLNDTKVIKARLLAKNSKGQKRELLLLEDHHNTDFTRRRVLYRGNLLQGETLLVGDVAVQVTQVLDGGIAEVTASTNLLDLAEHAGSVPLPPYMHREATKADTERYQTVFARQPGSVAAPTASLNFTHDLEAKLRAKGAIIAYLTLHVGLGTFLPIRTGEVESHNMHSEYFEMPPETVITIQNAKKSGNKIFAVGTTVARTLEYNSSVIISGLSGLDGVQGNKEKRGSRTYSTVSEASTQMTRQSAKSNGGVSSSAAEQTIAARKILTGEADIFIYPGYEFKVVDGLLTNFHAPKSTVLMLAAAFAGWDNLKSAYENALKNDYQFLSYGDSMLIL